MVCTNNILYHRRDGSYYLIPESAKEFNILIESLASLKNQYSSYHICYINFRDKMTSAIRINCEEFQFAVFIGVLSEKCKIIWE